MNLNQKTIRLDKFLSSKGLASRRKISQFLEKNKVSSNGTRLTKAGSRIDPQSTIFVNGKKLKKPILEYWLVNKPKGVISTAKDEAERKTIVSLVDSTQRLFPVGRLDKDTTGAIILTNDGQLTNKLTHPKYHLPKTYQAEIEGRIIPKKLEMIRNGVPLEDGQTAPAKTKIIKENKQKTILEITLFEGKNRQIRRMCLALGLPLLSLKRVSIGPLELANLKIGSARKLTKKEICLF
jgi:23S rRNA pseudouridine2605 synthase